MKLKVTVNGIPYSIEVEVEEEEQLAPTIVIGGAGGMNTPVATTASVRASSAHAVTAPLSGSVKQIFVEDGQEVKEGDVLVILEAMKMETELTAPRDGVIARVLVSQGESVAGGDALIEFQE